MRKRIFRFDDICVNADMDLTIKFAEHIRDRIPSAQVIFCISPLVHDMSSEKGITAERIFPKIFNAHSDYRKFYKVDNCGIPVFPDWITRADGSVANTTNITRNTICGIFMQENLH